MAVKPFHILCTRPVSQALVDEAATEIGLVTDTIEFIDTVAIKNEQLTNQVRQMANEKGTVIFTSMNAVDAVTNMLGEKTPSWQIFSMGNTTRQLVVNHFGQNALIDTGSNATELANSIVAWQQNKQATKKVVFFCGDQRRDELPKILKENSIALQELTVYKTIETPWVVEKSYDAILFFSPSAVHSYFAKNQPQGDTIFFAIGETTAAVIKNHCNNKIVVANTPAKDELFRQCIQYFKLDFNNKQPETDNQ